jgi:Ca-activated chloride channel family protein
MDAADEDGGVENAPPVERAPLPVGANPFVLAAHDALSTFGADVDTASYDQFRAAVTAGYFPSPESVRLEDFVNYFGYDYPAPAATDADPFAISLAAARGLTPRQTTLLRVGIQAEQPPPFEKKKTHVVFLIDVSGSMAEELPLVQDVLTAALDTLADEDRVSIVTYANGTQLRLPPTPLSERQEIASVIDDLESGGGTNGEGGIQLAYAQAERAFIAGGINHVVLCTDGDFNVGASSDEALVELIKQKRETGVTLTALGFGTQGVNDSMLEKVSNAGDGIYSVITSQTQAERYARERLLSTLVHVAKDMKIQVEFNPALVRAYRLLGYEDRAIADADFRNDTVDAGDIGAGHRVTALYELVLGSDPLPEVAGDGVRAQGETGGAAPEVSASDLVLVKVRYKQPGATTADPASEVSAGLAPESIASDAEGADDDLRWAAAIAAFAEILKDSPYGSIDELGALAATFEAQAERDADRAELLRLFEATRALPGLNTR